jgi:uncharacterized membrane protein
MGIEKKIPFLNLLGFEEVKKRTQVLRSFKAKADAKRTFAERFADQLTTKFGSMVFLLSNVAFFTVWILVNSGVVPGVRIFDPFPFSLLTTAVSLEAIILAIFVLISQNRAAKTEDIREEVELEINIIAEKEVTKLMKMVALLLEKQGVDLSQDQELQKMLKTISAEQLEKRLEKEIK